MLKIILLIFLYFIIVSVVNKYRVVSNSNSFFFTLTYFCEEHNMHYSRLYGEDITKNIEPKKWWYHCWIKIIYIYYMVLTTFAVTVSLLLKFVILALKKPKIIIIAATITSLPVATSTSTITMTTTRYSGTPILTRRYI